MKDVCFVTPGLRRGGMERVLCELANYGVSKGIKVAIICLIPCEIGYELDQKVTVYMPKLTHKRGILFKLKIFQFLFQTLKVLRPSVVLGFSEVFNPLSIVACKLLSIKVYVSDRSNPLRVHKRIDRLLRKFTYPFAMGLIAQTERAKNIFISRKYNTNIKVIPNPIKQFNNDNFNSSLKAIIHVGSLIPRKNQSELIKIFDRAGLQDWKLYLVGNGPMKQDLLHLIKRLNLKERVFLVGEVSNIDEWLSKGSIFAFCSLAEGFPNALNEAMAFPLAVISYDCPTGISELIEDNVNGYIIPMHDQETFCKRLQLLANDEELRLKFMRNSIQNRKKYSSDMIGDMYFN
ncbi:MAG: glycosyltransferase family 4 protein, partial [Pedobacter sp.]